jgi:hypothetical protein
MTRFKKLIATFAVAGAMLALVPAPAHAAYRYDYKQRGYTFYSDSLQVRSRLLNYTYRYDLRFACTVTVRGYRYDGSWGVMYRRTFYRRVFPRHYLDTSFWVYGRMRDATNQRWTCDAWVI